MLPCFLDLRLGWYRPSSGSRGSNSDVCQKRAGIQCRGLIIPKVSRGAVSKRRRQSLVDGRFQFEDRRSPFARFLRIECLKFRDALLQALDASSLLADCQDRRSWRRRWYRNTGHANLWKNRSGSHPSGNEAAADRRMVLTRCRYAHRFALFTWRLNRLSPRGPIRGQSWLGRTCWNARRNQLLEGALGRGHVLNLSLCPTRRQQSDCRLGVSWPAVRPSLQGSDQRSVAQ